jgi:hypothetical protein
MDGFIKSRDRDAARRLDPNDHQPRKGHDDEDDRRRAAGRRQQESPPRRRAVSGAAAVRYARAHLADLTGKQAEAVSALTRTSDGWQIVLEIVELERIPQSTDILASYAVDLSNDGELMGYQRIDRYCRCDVGGDR